MSNTREMQITTRRPDGRTSPRTPIWVVVVDDQVFVRTWQRRTTGWYGRATVRRRAVILISGEPIDVVVTATGDADAAAINDAYCEKYGLSGASSMITAEAQASTLHLKKTIELNDTLPQTFDSQAIQG